MRIPRRPRYLLILPVVLMVALGAAGLAQHLSAQPTLELGATIRTDRNQYRVGEIATICYSIPAGATPIVITDILPNGTTRVLLSGVDDGTGGCIRATVTPPTGSECLRLDVYEPTGIPVAATGGGRIIAVAQTCFRVQPAVTTVPPPSTIVSIRVDRPQYRVGETVQVCYTTPQPGAVVITDILANGVEQQLFAGPSPAGGGCVPATAGPVPGTECVRIDAYLSLGASFLGSSQTCFAVVGAFLPQPIVTAASIRTDQRNYGVGDRVQVCYTVPAPGPVVLTTQTNNGAIQAVFSFQDDGTGGCIVTPALTGQVGRVCVGLVLPPARVEQPAAQSCFQVGRG